MNETLAVIGVGNMGEAIIAGMLTAGTIDAGHIVCADQSAERLRSITDTHGVRAVTTAEAIRAADVVLLAVKPQNLAELLHDIGDVLRDGQTVITIVAGVPTTTYQAGIRAAVSVVRAMPNTPVQRGAGVTAVALAAGSHPDALQVAHTVFGSVGSVVTVAEDQMDAVTAVSGSGPAYLFFFTEALIEAGEAAGLDRAIAKELAIHTVYGSGVMLKDAGREPHELRTMVSSPGGTTVAALASMTTDGFTQMVQNAVAAAVARARELAAEAGQ